MPSNSKNSQLAQNTRFFEDKWEIGDSFYLMTDALSCWFLEEYEKGNNVAGTFSIVTAMLPMLKVSKWFRGIDANEFKILSETLANSGLSKTSTVKDYVEFYNGLTPGGKKIMDKLYISK